MELHITREPYGTALQTQKENSASTLRGYLIDGLGDARNWGIEDIREATGCPGLVPGTLNLRLASPHCMRPDAVLLCDRRTDERFEDLILQRCELRLARGGLRAWIARPSTNFHGDSVIEIMAEEILRDSYGLKNGDVIEVGVRA